MTDNFYRQEIMTFLTDILDDNSFIISEIHEEDMTGVQITLVANSARRGAVLPGNREIPTIGEHDWFAVACDAPQTFLRQLRAKIERLNKIGQKLHPESPLFKISHIDAPGGSHLFVENRIPLIRAASQVVATTRAA